jgi:hypothetical protein
MLDIITIGSGVGGLVSVLSIHHHLRKTYRQWEVEQTRRQDELLTKNVWDWTEQRAKEVATHGSSPELEALRPLVEPLRRFTLVEFCVAWLLFAVGLWVLASGLSLGIRWALRPFQPDYGASEVHPSAPPIPGGLQLAPGESATVQYDSEGNRWMRGTPAKPPHCGPGTFPAALDAQGRATECLPVPSRMETRTFRALSPWDSRLGALDRLRVATMDSSETLTCPADTFDFCRMRMTALPGRLAIQQPTGAMRAGQHLAIQVFCVHPQRVIWDPVFRAHPQHLGRLPETCEGAPDTSMYLLFEAEGEQWVGIWQLPPHATP